MYWYQLEEVDFAGNRKRYGTVSAKPLAAATPQEFCLHPNYPNPFNSVTKIAYDLPQDGFVKLAIYDMRGKEVSTLMKGEQAAGSYNLEWDGRNRNGEVMPSGVYLLRMTAGNYSKMNKMIFVR